MRIVSGIYKGRHIQVHKKFSARPTTDFAKENIFNVINNYFDWEKLSVLDLFSGTGSISYEFASRGCLRVVSVEKDFRSHSFIQETVKNLQDDKIKAIKSDVFRFLEWTKEKYDIIFADPPYELKGIEELPKVVFEKKLLKPEGWFILEHGKNSEFQGFQGFKEKREYGSVNFSIFENQAVE
ncbi:MAG: RsmD family RNA methyltransferase [Bacteroidales bacterium]|nr:RsmD family RNA methyltransferase [Bacteroidales bacterium]MBN2819910.1 RsmD family RNA methyltransferase [Bacteroidales bacterium]